MPSWTKLGHAMRRRMGLPTSHLDSMNDPNSNFNKWKASSVGKQNLNYRGESAYESWRSSIPSSSKEKGR